GLLTEAPLQNSPVSIWRDVVGTPGSSVQLPAPVVDVAVDPLGHRAYLALAGRTEVSVLDLGSMTFQTPVAVPVPPSALDVAPQGQTLVVALPRVEQVPVTHALGILNLAAPNPLEVIPLPREPAEFGRGPSALRVTSRSEALVVMSINGSGEAGYLFGYDLAARSFRGGGTLGLPDRMDNDTKLARSADGTRVLFYYGGSCCPTSGQLYDAVADDLLAVHDGVAWYGAPLSMTRVGDQTLIKSSLYGAALQPVREYHPPGEGEGSALSESGVFAYFRVGGGFLRTRLADGVSLERFVLPETPVRLVTIPGAVERVLALSASAAYLTHIGSSSGVAARRFDPTISAVELYQSVSR
ncbi:MAG TPA: hypothetical protein VFS51_08705, partial [Gemmatimonadales bacterium]|nr:hypothetical protein [Gemmatimonadales bacterium]